METQPENILLDERGDAKICDCTSIFLSLSLSLIIHYSLTWLSLSLSLCVTYIPCM
jgi:hypothetical protein